MGLIITELKERKPDLPYFDDNFTGEYPAEAPFTISELEEIYPCASGKSKKMPNIRNRLRMPHIFTERSQRIHSPLETHYQCVGC